MATKRIYSNFERLHSMSFRDTIINSFILCQFTCTGKWRATFMLELFRTAFNVLLAISESQNVVNVMDVENGN